MEGSRRRDDWRIWVSSPPRLALITTGLVLLGFGIGYLITVLFVFPARDLAADLRRVPDVVGEGVEQARARIEDADLLYEEGAGFYDESEEGTVIAQDPLPGQMSEPGSTVSVTVSLGPRVGSVPDVIGLSEEQARGILQGSGYEGEVIWVDDEAGVGEVVGTRPAPGTPVELPGHVTLLVSAGPPQVEVPRLTSRALSEVRETLERLGLRLGVVSERSGEGAPGTVLEQRPGAGEEVARGTEIDLTVIETRSEARSDTTSVDDRSGPTGSEL